MLIFKIIGRAGGRFNVTAEAIGAIIRSYGEAGVFRGCMTKGGGARVELEHRLEC